MNWVTYGQVKMSDVKLVQHECRPVPGATRLNYISREHTFMFLGVIAQEMNSAGPLLGAPPYAQRDQQDRPAPYSLQHLVQELSTPRLRFNYYLGDVLAFRAPAAGQLIDPGGGPFPFGVSIVEVHGAGAILVRFGLKYTEVDPGPPDGLTGQDSPIIEWSASSVHDIDGDNQETTIEKTITVQMNKEFLYRDEFQGAPEQYPGQMVDYWLDRIGSQFDLVTPAGFKRMRARVEVAPDASQAKILLIDKEQTLNLGTLSPSYKFEATYTVITGLGGPGKDGAGVNSHGIINATAMGHKDTYRVALLRQCLALAVQKLATRPNFLHFTRAQVVYLLHETVVNIQVECIFLPQQLFGPKGAHCIIDDAGLGSTEDGGDIDTAFVNYRAAGEAPQGTSNYALAPATTFLNQTKGRWLGTILQNRIKGNSYDRATLLKSDFCDEEVTPSPGLAALPVDYGPAGADGVVVEVEVGDVTIPDNDWGFSELTKLHDYETAKLSTRYQYNSGVYAVPLAGIMPGGSPGADVPEVEVVRLHNQHTYKDVMWQNSAVGQDPPPYPSTNVEDTDDVLISTALVPHAPTPVGGTSAIGSRVMGWTTEGLYRYARKTSVKPGDQLATGKIPTAPEAAGAYTYPPTAAQDGYLPDYGIPEE